MKGKLNKVFVEFDKNAGPRKLCAVCKVYYVWFAKVYRCPQCGAVGNADDIIANTQKRLKADVSEPIVASKKKLAKKVDMDLPKGAYWIRDDTYIQ